MSAVDSMRNKKPGSGYKPFAIHMINDESGIRKKNNEENAKWKSPATNGRNMKTKPIILRTVVDDRSLNLSSVNHLFDWSPLS